MTHVGISFDDTLVDQLHWARMLEHLGLQGVFYVSPERLGRNVDLQRKEWYLTEDHLARIAEHGHLIGNHTWQHECPALCADAVVLESIHRASDWLDARGYEPKLLALPNGVRGGGWGDEILETLQAEGYALRDILINNDERTAPSGLPAALEDACVPLREGVDLRYFHDSHNVKDLDLATMLCGIAEAIKAGTAALVLPAEGELQWQ